MLRTLGRFTICLFCIANCVILRPIVTNHNIYSNTYINISLIPFILCYIFPPLACLKLHHSSGSSLVDHSVATLFTSDGIALSQRKRGTTLGTVVLDTQRLVGDMTMCGVGDGCWSTESFSLRRRHVDAGVGPRLHFFPIFVMSGIKWRCAGRYHHPV